MVYRHTVSARAHGERLRAGIILRFASGPTCWRGALLRSSQVRRPLSQILDETEQITIGILYKKLRLAKFNVVLPIPSGLDRSEHFYARCEKALMQQNNVKHLYLQIDAPAKRPVKLAGQPRILREFFQHDL